MGGFWILAIQNLGGGVVSDSITISTPTQYQIHQRDGSDEADIAITGTYSGTPTSVEARFNGGAWATIDASPTGGTFSGTLSAQAAGQGALTVRFTNDTDVNDSIADVGIGDVWLILGQSNANAWYDNNQSYTHATLKATKWERDGTGWEEYLDPSGYITTGGSVWPLVATHHMADQNVPCGFLLMAQNGTRLVDGPWDPGNPGFSYTETLARITEAGIDDLAGVIFNQGEADAVAGASQQDYYDTLALLRSSFEADTGIDAPWIVCQVGTTPGTASAAVLDGIRAAQVAQWEDNAGIYPGPVDYDRLDIHRTTDEEAIEYAGRLWLAMDAAVFDGTTSRGPRIQSVRESENRKQILVTFDQQIDDGLSIESDPWVVECDGDVETVADVSYSGSTLTLNLSSRLTGDITTVTFASGNDGAGHVVPTGADVTLPDASVVNLPAEPFINQRAQRVRRGLSVGIATPIAVGV